MEKFIVKNFSEGKVISEFGVIGKSKKTGTTIEFWPDDQIFEVTEFDYENFWLKDFVNLHT